VLTCFSYCVVFFLFVVRSVLFACWLDGSFFPFLCSLGWSVISFSNTFTYCIDSILTVV